MYKYYTEEESKAEGKEEEKRTMNMDQSRLNIRGQVAAANRSCKIPVLCL